MTQEKEKKGSLCFCVNAV